MNQSEKLSKTNKHGGSLFRAPWRRYKVSIFSLYSNPIYIINFILSISTFDIFCNSTLFLISLVVQFLHFLCQIFGLKFHQILFNFFCWFIKFLWNNLMICSYDESDWFNLKAFFFLILLTLLFLIFFNHVVKILTFSSKIWTSSYIHSRSHHCN